ncbi:glycoside hydrolase family 3 C-terminal domain-containing protein [Microbacterium sp. 18062]|uniref:glycoside hydrolase family 3 C-terminal domain-containing protein n=1 Tax=Microbacterium sp. 18062 TaxID=2681410 RepID=UPI001358449C|nr:glycoside hydrolase family 3 C-terminal domain-containing protein [Microbacterium sp. 18062]
MSAGPLSSLLDPTEKVAVLTGASVWRTLGVERVGLRSMVLSDGPSGVRGELWDERLPSLALPSSTALAATWDLGLAREYGEIIGREALRHAVDVVLGPTLNLQRSPLGGRHFEAFSEDPYLTGALAVAYVRGLQSYAVAACPKHFVGNESETARFTMNSVIDERTLRELYLSPFEAAVGDGGAWMVMSAYNSVNGTTCSESDLLTDPLKSEWGFDGVVVSDWGGVRHLRSARTGQDLVFPGPVSPWSKGLAAALERGEVDAAHIDDKVDRLGRLAGRVGALGEEPERLDLTELDEDRASAVVVAGESLVLLSNDGTLPIDGARLGSLAVIGEAAQRVRAQGGGSAAVMTTSVLSPLEALRDALPATDLRVVLGATSASGITPLALDAIAHPRDGEPGARVVFTRGDDVVLEEHRLATSLFWSGTAPTDRADLVTVETVLTPERTERVDLGFALDGTGRLFVDGELFLERELRAFDSGGMAIGFLAPETATAEIDLIAGRPVRLRLEYEFLEPDEQFAGSISVFLGMRPAERSKEALIAEAVAAAQDSDIALVVVGTNERSESEGVDRADLRLPGWQDELVEAVAAVNPRTVVVVNAGSPVATPWRDEVAAILVAWFPGEVGSRAIADAVLGTIEPGGRLPTTWPSSTEQEPVLPVTPVEGAVVYREGIHVGHRGWLRDGATPAYWFGHGLGYTTWEFELVGIEVPGSDGDGAVRVRVRNTGLRAGKAVPQIYLSREDSAVERPVRWLAGFAAVRLAAGAEAEVVIPMAVRRLAHWDGGWHVEPGRFTVHLGESVVVEHARAVLEAP